MINFFDIDGFAAGGFGTGVFDVGVFVARTGAGAGIGSTGTLGIDGFSFGSGLTTAEGGADDVGACFVVILILGFDGIGTAGADRGADADGSARTMDIG
jgi:hypothetical protein